MNDNKTFMLRMQARKEGRKEGWNEALVAASNIALAIDSNRGNEKEIAKAILELKQ